MKPKQAKLQHPRWPGWAERTDWRRAVLTLREKAVVLGRDEVAASLDRELSALWREEHQPPPKPLKKLTLTINPNGSFQDCQNRIEFVRGDRNRRAVALQLPFEGCYVP
jgi:hypothetical protein